MTNRRRLNNNNKKDTNHLFCRCSMLAGADATSAPNAQTYIKWENICAWKERKSESRLNRRHIEFKQYATAPHGRHRQQQHDAAYEIGSWWFDVCDRQQPQSERYYHSWRSVPRSRFKHIGKHIFRRHQLIYAQDEDIHIIYAIYIRRHKIVEYNIASAMSKRRCWFC